MVLNCGNEARSISIYLDLLFAPLGLTGTWLPGDTTTEPHGQPAGVRVGDRRLDDTPLAMWHRFNRFGFPRGAAALRAPSWQIEYGLGMMRSQISPLADDRTRIPGLIGHTGSTGSWLWNSPSLGLILAGTVDQASEAATPFRIVPRALAGLPEG